MFPNENRPMATHGGVVAGVVLPTKERDTHILAPFSTNIDHPHPPTLPCTLKPPPQTKGSEWKPQ